MSAGLPARKVVREATKILLKLFFQQILTIREHSPDFLMWDSE